MTSPMSFKEHTPKFGTPAPERAFSRAEYRRRLELVRQRIEGHPDPD